MGFTEILTLIFVLLKCFGVITWPWLLVFLPEIIGVAFYLLVLVLNLCSVRRTHKRVSKHFDF